MQQSAVISDPGHVFVPQCEAEDISIQREVRPYENHLENFKT